MPKYSYIAQRYSQGSSEMRLLSFCADAADILRWGGVPSKNERFHGGFQRALSARYKKIIEYFNNSQASPGAVVVAFRQGVLTQTELGHPPAWPLSSDLSTQPHFIHIAFDSEDDEALSLEDLVGRVRRLLENRPGFALAEPSAPDDAAFEATQEDSASDLAAQTESTEEDEDEDALDVGQSKVRAFYDFITNPDAIAKWCELEHKKIAELQLKKNLTRQEKEYVSYTPEERLRGTLVSLIRPAMIVDGQHRVNGANESERDGITFTVCAIEDADWVEQVFQFVVLNKMAKPISKDFLTELLNTSLTNKEIADIDKRLEVIGIKNADRRLHKYINHDHRSPFVGLVAEAGEVVGADNSGKLSQQGMLALAKRWRAISSTGHTNEMAMFMPYLQAITLGDARKAWADYERWVPLFFAFWEEVRNTYAPQQVWVKQEKYHLLYIVTLQALQDLFISAKAKGKVKFKSLDDFRSQVRDFFADVPGAFFLNWSQTGLQSGTGWSEIQGAIEMFQNGTTLPKVQQDSKLFKK